MLRYKEDRKTIALVAAYYVLSFYLYFAGPSSPLLITAGVLATCWMSFVCATITHNVVHTPVFHSRSVNRFFQLVLTWSYGHPVSAFVPGHNLSHHLHTQTRRDVMRTTKARFRWNLLNQVLFPVVVARDITRADAAYVKAMKTERPRWYRQWRLEMVFYWTMQIALLAWDWQAFILYMLIPHLFAAWGIVGMNFIQHDGCDQDHPYNHSRNLVGPWINWWTCNNGFHALHHDKPGLHWSRLPAGHVERISPHVHPNLEVTNLLTYCIQAYVWPGRRVDYLGEPLVLPDEGPDESWIPKRGEHPDGDASLGAAG